MNRFTKDMAIIEDMLPPMLFDLIQVLYNKNVTKNFNAGKILSL